MKFFTNFLKLFFSSKKKYEKVYKTEIKIDVDGEKPKIYLIEDNELIDINDIILSWQNWPLTFDFALSDKPFTHKPYLTTIQVGITGGSIKNLKSILETEIISSFIVWEAERKAEKQNIEVKYLYLRGQSTQE